MSEINDGGPAFPVAEFDHQTFAPKTVDEVRRLLSGMSLRDYFAAKAMQALISGPAAFAHVAALNAYEFADAMLKARQA
jgi:hypothetical protein